MALREIHTALLLLLLLLATSTCPQDLPQDDEPPAADVLWTFLTKAVEAATEPRLLAVQSQLQEAATQRSGLQSQLQEAAVERSGLQSQLQEAATQRSGLQSQLQEAAAERSGLQTQLQEAATQRSGLQTQLLEAATQRSGLQSQLQEAATQRSALKEQLDSLGARLEKAQADLLADIRELRSQLLTDCSDLPAGSPSGNYTLRVGSAYCDQETAGGGWTVIQRRADIQPREDFYRGWQDYKRGFGKLDAEFWWGLENMWLMTTTLDRKYELRVELEDFDGNTTHALYQDFRLTSEADGYRLKIRTYTGDAGDSLTLHADMKFSTKDRDQDENSNGNSCAEYFKGAWWFKSCYHSHLNGPYKTRGSTSKQRGIIWHGFRGKHYSLKNTEMKIRPASKP